PLRVTRHDFDDQTPVFSPDGTQIAFYSARDDGGIYVVPALGGSERMLVKGGYHPRYSPDGRWLAYLVGVRAIPPQIWVIPVGGGTPRRISPSSIYLSSFDWSPDGNALLGM